MAGPSVCSALVSGTAPYTAGERGPQHLLGRPPFRASGGGLTSCRLRSNSAASSSGGSGTVPNALNMGRRCATGRTQQQRGCRTVVAAHGRGSFGSLSSYALPVHRSAARALPSWFEFCVRDVVTNLGSAPFVQAVYEGRAGRRTQFVTHAFTEEMTHDEMAFSELTHREDFGVADTLMFVHRVSAGVSCVSRSVGLPACGREQMRLPAAGGMLEEMLLKEGLVGDCEGEEDLGAEPCNGVGQASETNYWGLVVQSRGDGPDGCFLLKTTQKVGGDCKCTHYSLTRVCQGVPLEQQLVQAWSR